MRDRTLGTLVVFLCMLAPASVLAQNPATDSAIPTDLKADAYRLFLLGRHLERQGEIDRAIRAFREASVLDPDTGEILGELAALYARRTDPEEAERAADEALERDPDNLTAHRILGIVFSERVRAGQASETNTSRAIEHLEQARGTMLPDLQVELTLARLYLTAEQSDRAVGLLEQLLEDQPGLTEAGLLLSTVQARAGRVEDAVATLEGVMVRGRPSSRVLRQLGEFYGQVGRWSDAVGAYERAMARNPRSSRIQRELASALLQDGQTQRGRDVLRQLSGVRPDDVAVLYQLSEVELDLGNFDEAAAVARRLIALEPRGIRGPNALAEVYVRQHDYRAAIDTLEGAVAVQRQSQATRNSQATRQGRARPYQIASLLGQIGFAYEQLHEYDGAIEAYTQATDLLPLSLAYGARRVRAYLDAGRIPEATAALEAVSPHHPGDLTVARLQARVLGEGGDVGGGVDVLRDALGEHDRDPVAHLALAAFYSEYARLDEALEVLEAATVKLPDNLTILFQLGAVLEQSARDADAERAFRGVLDRDSDHAETLNSLGYMLADRGDRLEESVELLQRAVAIDPRSGAYRDSLGWAYFKLERFDLAETYLRQASEQMDLNSVIQDHFGDLMLRLGRYDDAVAAWEAALAGDREDLDVTAVERKIQAAQR